jgi:23S rRNA pseudouridine1911/1915/1917 synthase
VTFSLEPKILFEDQHLVVLSKPAGLLSQGEHTGDENLVDWLRTRWGRPYVGLVHRLDRNTSGLIVVAKRTKAAQRLTLSLQKGELVRTYQALLCGRLPGPAEWRHFLQKDERTNVVRVLRGSSGRGVKEARLGVRPLRIGGRPGAELTLAEFVLDTGRSHQIRVQAAAEQLPVLGDVKYGGPSAAHWNGLRPLGPALHSCELRFPHPMGGAEVTYTDAVPNEWERWLG